MVFSSWPNWTSEDMTSADYCMETPMLFAFVLQIVRWVSWRKDISINKRQKKVAGTKRYID